MYSPLQLNRSLRWGNFIMFLKTDIGYLSQIALKNIQLLVFIICHSISMGIGLAVFKSDWSRPGLRIFPYENRLLSSNSLTDSNALIKTRRKAEVHRKQYFEKTCIKIFRKVSEMLEKIFGIVKNCQKTVKNVFNSHS